MTDFFQSPFNFFQMSEISKMKGSLLAEFPHCLSSDSSETSDDEDPVEDLKEWRMVDKRWRQLEDYLTRNIVVVAYMESVLLFYGHYDELM